MESHNRDDAGSHPCQPLLITPERQKNKRPTEIELFLHGQRPGMNQELVVGAYNSVVVVRIIKKELHAVGQSTAPPPAIRRSTAIAQKQ